MRGLPDSHWWKDVTSNAAGTLLAMAAIAALAAGGAIVVVWATSYPARDVAAWAGIGIGVAVVGLESVAALGRRRRPASVRPGTVKWKTLDLGDVRDVVSQIDVFVAVSGGPVSEFRLRAAGVELHPCVFNSTADPIRGEVTWLKDAASGTALYNFDRDRLPLSPMTDPGETARGWLTFYAGFREFGEARALREGASLIVYDPGGTRRSQRIDFRSPPARDIRPTP